MLGNFFKKVIFNPPNTSIASQIAQFTQFQPIKHGLSEEYQPVTSIRGLNVNSNRPINRRSEPRTGWLARPVQSANRMPSRTPSADTSIYKVWSFSQIMQIVPGRTVGLRLTMNGCHGRQGIGQPMNGSAVSMIGRQPWCLRTIPWRSTVQSRIGQKGLAGTPSPVSRWWIVDSSKTPIKHLCHNFW